MEGACRCALLRFVTTCLALLVIAQSAAAAPHLTATGGRCASKTTAKVACKRLPDSKKVLQLP